MQYWWVNQNQTHKYEVSGGYMWSPKTNIDGGKNQFYINMTLVQPGDIVYSFYGTYIQAIGVVMKKAISSPKPSEFGISGANWSNEGWYVETEFYKVSTPIKPANHMNLIGPTLPETHSPLQPNGNGNQVYLAQISESMANVLNGLFSTKDINTLNELKLSDIQDEDEIEDENDAAQEELSERKDITETEKLQLVKARRGQGLFKSRVGKVEKSCRITGVNKKKHLRASHIKPWSKSNDLEKLDGNNGLMLSPHVDHLFDRGYISFTDNGKLLLSSKLDHSLIDSWKIDTVINVGEFNANQSLYLEYHRNHIFLK